MRWYCRYPLSYRDVRDLLCERGIHVDAATINRWVVKFGPLIDKRVRAIRNSRTMGWHVDETYIRVSGKWRYLWRIVDKRGRFVDFRLTAKRDSKAARGFLTQAKRNCELYPPMCSVTDKAPVYPAIIRAMDPHAYSDMPVKHINHKGSNNLIESDRVALIRVSNPAKGFQSLRTAKPSIQAIDACRTIK